MNSRVLHNVYKLKKLIDRKIKNMADIRSRANCNSIFMGSRIDLGGIYWCRLSQHRQTDAAVSPAIFLFLKGSSG